ncbi:conserved hypothetical protein [Burkholderia cenocepacia]|nr:conserved hypothetical protein [Burkholderia cenocepacia]
MPHMAVARLFALSSEVYLFQLKTTIIRVHRRPLALTLPAPPPTLARVLVLARAAPACAVKRETGSLPAPQSSQPVLPPQR